MNVTVNEFTNSVVWSSKLENMEALKYLKLVKSMLNEYIHYNYFEHKC